MTTANKSRAIELAIVPRAAKLPSDLAALNLIDAYATHGYRASRVNAFAADRIRTMIAVTLETSRHMGA